MGNTPARRAPAEVSCWTGATSQHSTTETAFGTSSTPPPRPRGVLSRQKLVRVSDGGAYFIEHSDELFCDQPLLGILDCQHAKQHVWEAGHKVVADKKEVPSWVLPRTKAIVDGKVHQVISGLGQEREHATGSKAVKALDDLTGYLSRHKHMMDYPAYHAAGYPLASAAIESTNKRLVGRRCRP